MVAGVGRVAVAREPEVRARLKLAEQALDLLKNALVIFGQPIRRAPLSNCHAHAESFWRRFKAERPAGGNFPGPAEARLESSRHTACSTAERRSALGSRAPNRFEARRQTASQPCPV